MTEELTTSYNITNDRVDDVKSKNQEAHDKLLERIMGLVRRSSIDGVPVVGNILEVTKDPAELRMIARVLERLADLVPEMEKFVQRQFLLEAMDKQKNWMQMEFGDFDAAINKLVNQIENNKGVDE